MNKKLANISRFIKTHKATSIACTCALVLGLGLGGFGIARAISVKQVQDNVLSQMDEQDNLDAEDIQTLADNGHLGEEIVDPNTGETVVLTQNDDGTIAKTVVSNNNKESTGHTHSWVAHTATRTVQTGTRYVVDVPGQAAVYKTEFHYICNTCGGYVDSQEQLHYHRTHGCNGCSHDADVKVLVTPAVEEQGHNEPVYGTEQYIDYYYCSDCGARQ